MRRDPPKKPDALTLLARASAARRRRSPVAALVMTAIVLALLTLFAWMVWPGPEPRQLVVAAFDALARPGEPVTLRAQLEALDAEDAALKLTGYDLYFVEPETGLQAKAATSPQGLGSVEHTFPAPQEQPVEFVVRCPGGDRGRGAPDTSGRVFLWPADAAILVVDADHALADAGELDLRAENSLDFHPLPGVLAALQKTAARYRTVYLTAHADRPIRYLTLNTWLKRSWTAAEQFPDGPLLLAPDAGEPALLDRAAVEDLKNRFPAAAVGVARRGEEARLFRDAGLRTFLVGEAAEVPEGVTAVPSWADVARRLVD